MNEFCGASNVSEIPWMNEVKRQTINFNFFSKRIRLFLDGNILPNTASFARRKNYPIIPNLILTFRNNPTNRTLVIST